MTNEMMKKASATMPSDSRHVRPMAMMDEANCHVAALENSLAPIRALFAWCLAYLKASDIQYVMKLVTPHFRRWRGTGSRSLFVLFYISTATLVHHCREVCTDHRELPSAKADFVCCVLREKLGFSKIGMLSVAQAYVEITESKVSVFVPNTDMRASLSQPAVSPAHTVRPDILRTYLRPG
jgi:hypothetical protein